MSPLQALAPDQRAVLELLLRQGRVLRGAVRAARPARRPASAIARHAALAALAPDRVAPVGEDGAVADWILGQQDDAEAAADRRRRSPACPRGTRGRSTSPTACPRSTARSCPRCPQPSRRRARPAAASATAAREARGAPRRRPRPVRDGEPPPRRRPARAPPRRGADAAAGPPRRPAAPRRPPPAPAAARCAPPASAALVLIGVRVILVGGLLAWFLTRDDDDPSEPPRATPTPTATAASATPRSSTRSR